MMNKLKSAKVHALRFLFVLPLLSVLLLAFRSNFTGNAPKTRKKATTDNCIGCDKAAPSAENQRTPATGNPESKNYQGRRGSQLMDTVLNVTSPNRKEYFIDVKGKKADSAVLVKGKDGKEVKSLLLTEWNKKEQYYTDLYGEILPPPPPPPPPTPQTLPVKNSEDNLNGISDEYVITDKKAILKLKDGTIEKYNLTNPDQRAAFENKYGKIISTLTNSSADLTTVAVASSSGKTVTTPVTTISSKPVEAATGFVTVVKGSKGNTVISPVASTTVEGVTILDDYGYTITGKEDILITISRYTTRQEQEGLKK